MFYKIQLSWNKNFVNQFYFSRFKILEECEIRILVVIYETVKVRSKNLGTILGLHLKCCYFDEDKGLGVVLNEISK